MKTTRIMAVAAATLFIASGLPLHTAQSHQLEVNRTDAATRDAPRRETVTVAADKPIPNLPGKRLVSLIVDYPPGRARTHTVTPARLSSTPTSFRARSEARSMASLPASTGPASRGSRAPALIIG